jgi:hypothetical protein
MNLALQVLEMFVGDFLELLYRLVFLAAVHRSADCRFADRRDHRYDVQKMKSGARLLRYALGEPQTEQ